MDQTNDSVETNKLEEENTAPVKKVYIQRFDAYTRLLHVMVIVSFLTLALTGMIIKFSGIGIFQTLSKILGGYQVTGILHRMAAVVTFAYFGLHLFYLIKKIKLERRPLKYMLSGENSMVPQLRDLTEFVQTMKWFFGRGPRPKYGRWTYWEKFDYFAVFWGVAIIGFSGLILWFPEFFTSLGLPGWFINVASIIHSDEALLATGFIFTVHFFNTHFRPDKFPMDTVIFTGCVELEEFKEDRPRQYEELLKSGKLEEMIVEAPRPKFLRIARIFGFSALFIGLSLVLMIMIAMLFLYN